MTEYGLIGFPLGHSFSRSFFTKKFADEGTDATYLNFEIPDINMLPDIINGHPNLKGLNCTIPHKEAVLALLDDVSEEAKEIGAVNVLKIQRGKGISKKFPGRDFHITGYNSDIIGFCESISPMLKPHHRNALILGTGGAAKAISIGLKKMGLTYRYVSRKGGQDRFTYVDITDDIMQEYQVVVNCTPVGMFPHTDDMPPLPYHALTDRHLLYDLVYNPEETLFLKLGAQAGAATKNGLDMLHLQAMAGWDIWSK